ncbi:MAG: M23 family metallopeptidase [Lachnospiraceae bacterium]|nr:M23 family metallopeptidase [Lachnospiraceae bacterium]
MRRDRKNKIKKERMVMIASSALVMGALTLTGIYMKDRSAENIDDGYTIDFSQLEENVDDKAKQIAENMPQNTDQSSILEQAQNPVTEDDLDYDPLAAGSNVIQIPGLTDQINALENQEELARKDKDKDEKEKKDVEKAEKEKVEKDSTPQKKPAQSTVSESVMKTLNFTADQGLVRPVSGEILMYYSMDKSIYFATLDQYKYNPATVLSALEGDQVVVCADAKVISIYENEEIGHAVTLDLGNGYQATYGQLKDVQITEGSYVNRGEALGSVAAPTKYYTLEGPNLYFQVTKDGTPVNPEELFQ